MIPLAKAARWANQIATELAPLCDQIEIAGSIRRGLPQVNDIDLVVLPRDKAALKYRCKRNAEVIQDGDENCSFRLAYGIQIDIFFARAETKDLFQTIPTNWGSLLLCRTGSKEHNQWLCERARKYGLKWSYPKGLIDEEGYIIAAQTEAEIYDTLDLPVIAPPTAKSTGSAPLSPSPPTAPSRTMAPRL
jgi:DNA polymerase (family 10)